MLDQKEMQEKIQEMINGLEFILVDLMQNDFDEEIVEELVESASTKVQMAIDDLETAMGD